MSNPAHNRVSADATAPDSAGEVRLSRSARRHLMRDACAARVAAGEHVPGRPRSLFESGEIASEAAKEIAERAQVARAAADRLGDRQWAHRPGSDVRLPVSKIITR